jgi:uncharacterized membrane protein YgdD (TMEM256/DUF423 family)
MRKINSALSAWASLMGACGVASAAVAAHMAGAERLSSVALILLAHAAAVLALTLRAGRLFLASALAMAFGATLFALDVALFTLRGGHLFPLAAPSGGVILILAWLLAFFSAISELRTKEGGNSSLTPGLVTLLDQMEADRPGHEGRDRS